MEESPEKKEPIKVIDRRSFTADGQRRAPDPEPEAPTGGASAPDPGPAEPPRAPIAGDGFTIEPPTPGRGEPAGQDAAFMNLVVSLFQSGCLHLGLGEDGEPTGAEADLDGARATIEMLAMMKRKTQGNLSKEEAHILDSLLAELRMAYVMKAPGA